VVFPALRVVHAGDIFSGKNIPLLDANNGGSGVLSGDTLSKAARSLKNIDTVITGHSTGAMLQLTVGVEAPELPRALVLSAGTYFYGEELRAWWRDRTPEVHVPPERRARSGRSAGPGSAGDTRPPSTAGPGPRRPPAASPALRPWPP